MKIFLSVLIFMSALIINAQTILKIEGKTYVNSDETWLGVNIPRSVPTNLAFKNNSIKSVNTLGYMLQAGDETAGSNNNNLDGAVITGNKFIWSGTDMKSITHGLFTGHNINVSIKYNYLDHVPMAIIRKSGTNLSNTAGGVAYNIVKSPNVGIVIKGMSGVCIYNNTFYQDRTKSETGRGLIDIYSNSSASPISVSHGTKIFNNIFYTKYETFCINVMDKESLTGFESDYNVFWCETGSPKFNAGGSVKTFEQWQALGYDTHSVVINPDFKDLINFVPAKRLDYGKNLGSEFINGLSADALWSTTDPKTTAQNSTWQVGAIIYAAPVNEAPVVIISSPNKSVTYSPPASVTIEAIASDPDGEISKVEFFAGTVKLGEVITVPYSFTWKDVPAGTYTITAKATDNLNNHSVSESITVNINNLSTSIEGSGYENQFSSGNKSTDLINLYPNPSNGIFKIDLLSNLLSEVSNITIANIKGEILYRGILKREESIRYFDLSHLDSGNYIMTIKSGHVIHSKKIIKY